MAYGELRYDSEQRPICEICGKGYDKLGFHVWRRHGIKAKDYKAIYGLDKGVGLISEKTRREMSKVAKENIDINMDNLSRGKNTRFIKGQAMPFEISEQTRKRRRKNMERINEKKYGLLQRNRESNIQD